MGSPLVSVLIPCYNAERWIGETLSSVLDQTHTELEIIVVDDGSTDGSREVLSTFTDPRIRVIRQSNGGAAKARNTAFAASRGSFIQFLDADDLLDPEKLTHQLERLRDHPGSVAASSWARFTNDPATAVFLPDPTDRDLPPVDWLVEAWREGGGMLFPGRWLIPRSVAEKAGPWDDRLTLNDDGEYFTRVLLASDSVLFCRGAKCYYRSGIAGSLSRTRTRQGWESYARSVRLCGHHTLGREDSTRVRRAVSFLHQRFAHACYVEAPDLAEAAMRQAQELNPDRLEPDGGGKFRLLRRLIGWRLARRLQAAYYRRRHGHP